MFWKKLDLEISLKPFADHSEAGIRKVAFQLFSQWRTMIEQAGQVSLMFWASDGSEILDYNGKLEDTFEWAKWIGVANPHHHDTGLPTEQRSIHESPRLYMENPPEYTYADFKRVLTVLKQVFRELYGRELRLGTTFDSGPEFAVSSFKYERHPEICRGFCLGGKTFVCCYMKLNADSRPYAGFPNGIPEGTTFGTFLGRQSQHFLTDLGFDYLWLSNGFGFGLETWGYTGAIFDGNTFSPERASDTKEAMFGFWNDFRRECPNFPLETRGTNLSTGMDLASDATPLREIYKHVKDMEVPVNSPWAALNYDFGMELAGWMSHIAELPDGKGFPFRFYTHDPWFVNSPWLDRYSRSPYDIYLPLSINRLDAKGKVETPNALHILTVDDSYGRMPDIVPVEVSAYLNDAAMTMPDAPGPFIWVYPFDEYHDEVYAGRNLEEVFAGDFLIRGAINQGFPVNTVITGGNFVKAVQNGVSFAGNVLVLPTIFDLSPAVLAEAERHLEAGGDLLLYGSGRGSNIEKLIGLVPAAPVEGECELAGYGTVNHLGIYSGGPLDRIAAPGSDAEILAEYVQGKERRPAAILRRQGKGRLLWIRGTNSFRFKDGDSYSTPFDPKRYFYCDTLFRTLLNHLGYAIEPLKKDPLSLTGSFTLRRHKNALYMVEYAPDTTGDIALRFPDGAPVFARCDTEIKGNKAIYHRNRAGNYEARIFLEKSDDSIVSCRDVPLTLPGIHRRIRMKGLKNATVAFRPVETDGIHFNFIDDSRNPSFSLWGKPDYEFELVHDASGPKYIIRNVTGQLDIIYGVRHEYRP